eukprot:tig00020723_g13445.t1
MDQGSASDAGSTTGRDGRSRTRLKDMLKDFYGKGAKAPDGNDKDTANIDGVAFDAQKYYEKLLAERSLAELIGSNNDLVSEIKTLDNDMQMLVYENYNKFISATDTIRKMKTNVESMENEMEKLSSTVDEISRQSEAINSNLSAHRYKIEQLNGVRRLLKKLQFLFQLPDRLNRAIKLEAYSQAVKYYATSANVLRQYSHMASFGAIYQEAEAIADALRERLRERMTADGAPFADVAECVRLLVDLREPEAELRTRLLESRREILKDKLEVAMVQEEAPHRGGKSSRIQDFLSEFVSTANAYQTLFMGPAAGGKPAPGAPAEAGPSASSSSAAAAAGAPQPSALFKPAGAAEARREAVVMEARRQLTEWSKELFGDYFAMTSTRLTEEDYSGRVGELAALLSSFFEETAAVHKVVPDARLADRAADVVERTVGHLSDDLFGALRASLVQGVSALAAGAGGKQAMADAVGGAVRGALEESERALLKLKPLVAAESGFLASYAATCTSLVHTSTRATLLALLQAAVREAEEGAQRAAAAAAAASPEAGRPTAVLLLAKFCLALDEGALAEIQRVLTTHFPPPRGSSVFKVAELKQEARSCADRLLGMYVEAQSKRVSGILRKGVESVNWLTVKPPKDVRLVAGLVLEAVAAVDAEVIQIVGRDAAAPPGQRPPEAPPRVYAAARPARGGAPAAFSRREIDRLFAQKLRLFAAPAFQHKAILTAIIRVALKGLIECVRLRTVSKAGFQQMQLDTHFLRIMLRPYVNEETVLETLADEVITSAADRCPEPVPLEQAFVDQVCEAKRALLGGSAAAPAAGGPQGASPAAGPLASPPHSPDDLT